ncbi:MAG: hypothetical protein ACI85F_000162 [Bacteroidia bacterium]|jgi:hypothetical protein
MEVVTHTRKMVEEWKADYPGHETYLSGIVMLNGAFTESAMSDMILLYLMASFSRSVFFLNNPNISYPFMVEIPPSTLIT